MGLQFQICLIVPWSGLLDGKAQLAQKPAHMSCSVFLPVFFLYASHDHFCCPEGILPLPWPGNQPFSEVFELHPIQFLWPSASFLILLCRDAPLLKTMEHLVHSDSLHLKLRGNAVKSHAFLPLQCHKKAQLCFCLLFLPVHLPEFINRKLRQKIVPL